MESEDFGAISGPALVGMAASVASAAAGIYSAVSKTEAPKTIGAPREPDIAQGAADARKRLLASRGYKATILSDLSSQYGGMGMKQNLGA